MSVRPFARRSLAVAVVALSFLAGGLLVPQLVSATVSSGEREAFFPLPPTRFLDTRFGPSPLPVGTKVGPGETIDIQVAGFLNVPSQAGAVVLNVTVVNPTALSLLTIHPAGIARPTASSLNFGPGDIRPNAVTAKIGAGGKVSIYNDKGTVDVVVDVNGYYENVTFDDRYDTKAQSDAKIATAVARPGHVTGTQVADGSLTGADVLDGSLGLPDLVGGRAFAELTLPDLSVPGKDCQVVAVDLGLDNSFRLMVPMRVARGVVGSVNLSAPATGLDINGGATIPICNQAGSTFTTTAPTLEYYVL